MNINNEKEMVYQIITELTAERRKLTEERFALTKEIGEWKERLNELNRLEEKGLDNLDTIGLYELRKKAHNNQEILNVTRETKSLVENMLKEQTIEEQPKEENKLFTVAEQEKEKDRQVRRGVGKEQRGFAESQFHKAISILKEAGVPMKADKLKAELEKELGREINYKTFANGILAKLSNHPKVTKPMRAFYQYNH
jgi:hypothetical protein